MFKFLSIIFWIIGIAFWLIGGIYGFFLSFTLLNDISSILAVIGLVFFPALYGVMPFYDLLANGSFELLLVNYGSLIAGGLFSFVGQWLSDKHEDSMIIEGEDLNAEIKPPSKWKYVGVFLLATFVANLIMKLLEPNLTSIYLEIRSIIGLGIFSSFYSIIIDSFIYILIYKQFNDLKISRVMPYIWIFYLLGKLFELGMVSIFDNGGDFLITMLTYSIVSYFGFCLIFRAYFKNKPQWGDVGKQNIDKENQRIAPTIE